jgi:hypothetical protein
MGGHLRRLATRGGQRFILGGATRLCRLDEYLPDVGKTNETEDLF